ncbi:MAG: hypothetical protein AAB512_00685 [Patescibacteria group bacterium]
MERRLPKPVEVGRFARKQATSISVVVGSSGLVTTTFMSGRVDTLIGVVGGMAAGYVAHRIITHPKGSRNELKDK